MSEELSGKRHRRPPRWVRFASERDCFRIGAVLGVVAVVLTVVFGVLTPAAWSLASLIVEMVQGAVEGAAIALAVIYLGSGIYKHWVARGR